MNTIEDRAQFNRSIIQTHDSFWQDQKEILQSFNEAYSSQFYSKTKHQAKQDVLSEWRIETPHAFNALEQYVTQLFMVAPAVEVSPDPALQKDVSAVETLVNRWLHTKRAILEDATRLALLNPQAYLKLWVDESKFNPDHPISILEAIRVSALKPWEIILDHEAESWESLRYIGHTYQTTLATIKKQYNIRGWSTNDKEFFFSDDKEDFAGLQSNGIQPPEQYRYLRINEIYDLVEGTMTIWTENHTSGYKELHHCPIPITTSDGCPLVPIVPIIFSWRPDNPLIGISTMARGWPLFKALNDLRTHMANVIHTQVRTYIANKKLFSTEVNNGLFTHDGRVILVDVAENETLNANNFIQPIQVAQFSDRDYANYERAILDDIRASTLLGPFARGEVTKATASEISVVSQYSNSEADKYRRQKNAAVEQLAMLYVRTLYSLMAKEDKFQLVIEQQSNIGSNDSQAVYVDKELIDGKLRYDVNDGGGSPITQAVKKQQYIELIPTLMQLGADPTKLRQELIRMFDLPSSLADEISQPEVPDMTAEQLIPNQITPTPQVTPTQGLI